jgi:hypothetical protein
MHDRNPAKSANNLADALSDHDLRLVLAKALSDLNLTHIRRVARADGISPIEVINRILNGSRKMWDHMEEEGVTR